VTAGILVREGVLLAVLLALGLGPAAYLPRSWGTAARIALAPAFGLAVGSAVLTTTAFFVPLRHSLWFAVLPLAAGSTFIAIRRRRLFAPGDLRRRELGALVLVAVWGIGVFSLPMLARQSYGPMGYGIFDAPGYGASIFGYARNTNDKPLGVSPTNFHDARYDRTAWGEPWDLTTRYAWGFVFQHNGATTIPAAFTIPFGWPAWTLVTPFMAVLSTVVGFGVFAAGMWFFERRAAAACLCAVLALGPVLFQIHVDGSLGLLAGLALFPAIMMCALWISRGGAVAGSISLGVLLAGLQAAYPELLPIAALTIVATCLTARGPTGRLRILGRRGVGLPLLTAGVLSVILSPRTIPWTVDYLFDLIARDLFSLKGLLVYYNMRPRYLLGWLFQTRDFYTFAFNNPQGTAQLWWGVVAPSAGLVLAGIAIHRRRQLVPFALLIAAAVVQALAGWRSDCQYCVQRSLIVVALTLPLLLIGGWLAVGEHRWRRVATAGVVGILLLGAASTLVGSERRAIDAAYLPSTDLRRMLPHAAAIPRDGAPLLVEGFNAVPIWSWADLPTTYMALRETGRRLSIVATWNEYGGFSYARTRPFGHSTFTSDYGWVLTRFGALDSGRATIAGSGPLALQRRAEPFDVSPVLGVAADVDDRHGIPWLAPPGKNFGLEQGPLTALVSGPPTDAAWVEVVLQAPPGTSIAGPPGTKTGLRSSGELGSCIPVPPEGPVRIVTLTVSPTPAGFVPSSEPNDPVYRPSHSIRLKTLRAHARPCPE
jgi:hypothetical protein